MGEGRKTNWTIGDENGKVEGNWGVGQDSLLIGPITETWGDFCFVFVLFLWTLYVINGLGIV